MRPTATSKASLGDPGTNGGRLDSTRIESPAAPSSTRLGTVLRHHPLNEPLAHSIRVQRISARPR